MVKSIVIPHDPTRSPRLRHLATASEFQAAVDGWLEPIEMPALNVTVYVNEAARRERQPINCRAMAIWWLHTANPMQHPIILGDVVLTGIAEDGGGTDVPDSLVQDIFEAREFVVQIRPPQDTVWHDTFARFADVFDAATWCMVLTYTLHPGSSIRLCSRASMVESESFDDSFRGSDAPW